MLGVLLGVLLGLVEQALQEGTTPAATGPGPVTFAQLTRHPRSPDPQELQDLPFLHVETEAQFVVVLHHAGYLPSASINASRQASK